MIIFLIEQIQSSDFEGWSYITKDNLLNYRISGYSCAIGNDPNIYARLYIACYDNNQNQVDWTFIGPSSVDSPNWQEILGNYTTPSSELIESFNSYPPPGYIEMDLGNLLQQRTSGCPYADSLKSGLSYLMTDTLDFSSSQPETLLFYWRVNSVEISTDLRNSWIRFSFYKNSTSGNSTNNNRFFNIDSVKVKNSYISRFNRLTNSSFETWLYTPEDNGRTAQLWIKRDTFKYSGNYSLKAFVTTILNPFNNCSNYPISEVDSFVVISDGGLIYVDSVNFKIYCYVGNITPIKDREFINLKRGFYFLLIENENRIILKRRLIT